MTDDSTRAALGDLEVVRGAVAAERDGTSSGIVRLGDEGPYVDTIAGAALVVSLPIPVASAVEDGVDPAPATMLEYLRCPAQQLGVARGAVAIASLDSLCKLR
jgi:hypothetical protein